MKRLNLSIVPSTVLLLSLVLPISSAYAQTVSADLAAAATEACTRSAESKGFQVRDVVSVESKAGTDGANVVLNLDRAGQAYKLTCGYSASAGAMIGDDTAAASVAAPNLSSLWWLLLPIIGLPLLLAWTKNRDRNLYPTHQERSEALVKNDGKSLSIHSGPDASHSVTGVLYDGQRVTLSGRRSDNWAELADGGWVPARLLDVGSYVTR
ncbi:MAG: SH3 domain-containing protein [Drouetiella hepatica Uher 2000/2452]|jgi:uncharacterized protein YgiM (DUF1202 family)|uniref:SH3 domain-containing protein n=1 Tax=Drouetiella hepatica Uher 2000/2452 TaxID=904376 RepID=A0A951QB13_9CYAN|nr:SH3 domain-containing protein [Drouetiella hepatica Uher 2000/2452]